MYWWRSSHHNEPSFRSHGKPVAQPAVHERFVVLGSHYPDLLTLLVFPSSTLPRHVGQHTHANTTARKFIFIRFVDNVSW